MTLFDLLHETATSIGRHKLRTTLTALSVAWGIFMLVLLLGAGRGLQNGVEHDFRDDAMNSIWVRSGTTSIPFAGQKPGRRIRFNNDDVAAIARQISGVDHITGRFYLWGGFSVSHGDKSASFDLRGCHPDHLYLEKTIMVRGRFINDIDVERRRKVAVIGPEVQTTLFGKQDPLGEEIDVRGVSYRVIGIYNDEGSENELRKIYIPISTAQLVYGGSDTVHTIMFTIGNADSATSLSIADATRTLLARRHRFSPDDKRALSINNNVERFQRVTKVFDWIRGFVWVVGIGTIFAGIVGVSNIMLISVKERTIEFGIRKALGARPRSIVLMVLIEASLITAAAGYLGLFAGTALVELFKRYLPENDYLRDPDVDFRVALMATAVIVVAGVLAGLWPSVRAARIKPAVAMRGS